MNQLSSSRARFVVSRSLRYLPVCVALLALALLAGCGSDPGQSSTAPTSTALGTTGTPPAVTAVPGTPGQSSGQVDACGWFSVNDASQVLGAASNPPTVQKAGGSSLCTYAAPSNSKTMLFVVQQGPNVGTRYHQEQQAAATATGYQVITGLGDSAFWTPIDGVVVLKGQTLFTMQVLHVQSQAVATVLPAEEQLLRTAISHLG